MTGLAPWKFENPFSGSLISIFLGPGVSVGVWGSGFRGQGSGFRVQDLGFRVWGSRFGVQVSSFRVQDSEFRIQGSGFRVQGSGFGVQMYSEAADASRATLASVRPRAASPRASSASFCQTQGEYFWNL